MDEVLFICIDRLDHLSNLRSRVREDDVVLALTAPRCGSMIESFGKTGDVDQVWKLWREMTDRGVQPTSITVGCTVDALVKMAV